MAAAPDDITIREKFFGNRALPRQLTILQSVTFLDLPAFVHKTIPFLKAADISDTMKRPRWEDLHLIKTALEGMA